MLECCGSCWVLDVLCRLQHALRLIAYDKLHLVLGVEPEPAQPASGGSGGPGAGTKRGSEEEPEGETKKSKGEGD